MHRNLNDRYSRQLLLPGFGQEKQELLLKARVLVIGAGGLGCPVLLYLAAAGVGHLGILDFDTVAEHNLHRQVLYSAHDVGQPKGATAAHKIMSAYPDTEVTVFPSRLDTSNALDIMQEWDVVVDGSDNFPTRYLVNDACVLLYKPLVYGSVYKFEGQVAVFNFLSLGDASRSAHYRDLFPVPPTADQIPNCSEAGVLGVLPGIIGNLMANETIKVITGMGTPLVNRLLTFHSLQGSFLELETSTNTLAREQMPVDAPAFRNKNYDLSCATAQAAPIEEISVAELKALAKQDNLVIVDVRNPEEQPKLTEYPVLHIPMPHLPQRLPEIDSSKKVVVLCQSGVRSSQAAQTIQAAYKRNEVYSLKGGMNAWIDQARLQAQ